MAADRDPLLIELIAAIGAGHIDLRPIHAEGETVQGCCETDGKITINPAHEIVSTCLHEAIHRMRPKWSERRVRANEAKLMHGLTDAEVDRLYQVILSVAKTKKRPKKLELD